MSQLRSFIHVLSVLGLGWATLLLTGCSSPDSSTSRLQASSPAAVTGASGGKTASPLSRYQTPEERISDTLREGDVVSIFFSGGSELPAVRYEDRIKNDGKIKLPELSEPIMAANKSRSQLEDDIVKAYVPRYYKHLTVTITSENRFFYVGGMVKNEGRFAHSGEMTVLRCIAAAGGFNDFAKKKNVQVTRADGRKLRVNCVEALDHPDKDLPIFPDDRIYVPRRYW
jgi:protein involved in polysaccharide export with SLBB domain